MTEGQGSQTIELRLKPAALEAHGLPDILYPLPADALNEIMGEGGALPFPTMLHALQQASAHGDANWLGYKPAMSRLAELIAPEDPRPQISAAGEEWWIEVGPVDLAGPVETIQRSDKLIAAMTARDDGRLRLAAYSPLDGAGLSKIIELALRPHPEDGTVCMRANNWEYAKDCSAGMGQVYASHRGEAYLSWWDEGLGRQNDGQVLNHWLSMIDLPPRPPPQVAIELGIAYAFSWAPSSYRHTMMVADRGRPEPCPGKPSTS